MLLRTKFSFIFVAFLFLSANIQSQTTDTNKIDTAQKIELIDTMQENNSYELDSLHQDSRELSFYEGYIEPIIAVVSVALITILLFSVRSKK